jgi:FkbM family methyltransferase
MQKKSKKQSGELWMGLRSIEATGRLLRRIGTELLRRTGIQGTWIDVGAHQGEKTLHYADLNPGLKIYALEPNLSAAAKLIGQATNYFVIPMAVAENDGVADFYINVFEAASSLLPFNDAALRSWVGGDMLKVNSVARVPTVRLDTLMGLMGIGSVDFLKVDTQGMDLAVVKSAGSRLRDIKKIVLEVSVTPMPLYSGAASREEVVTFLEGAGFLLECVEKQNHGQEENLTFRRTDQRGEIGSAAIPNRATLRSK